MGGNFSGAVFLRENFPGGIFPRTKNNIFYLGKSSHQRCPVKKGALKLYAKRTGKHLRLSLFFKKVADLRPTAILKKRF